MALPHSKLLGDMCNKLPSTLLHCHSKLIGDMHPFIGILDTYASLSFQHVCYRLRFFLASLPLPPSTATATDDEADLFFGVTFYKRQFYILDDQLVKMTKI